jgi:hypothetical protein
MSVDNMDNVFASLSVTLGVSDATSDRPQHVINNIECDIERCLDKLTFDIPNDNDDFHVNDVLDAVIHNSIGSMSPMYMYYANAECCCYISEMIADFLDPLCADIRQHIELLKTCLIQKCTKHGIHDVVVSQQLLQEYKEAVYAYKMVLSRLFVNHWQMDQMKKKQCVIKNNGIENYEGCPGLSPYYLKMATTILIPPRVTNNPVDLNQTICWRVSGNPDIYIDHGKCGDKSNSNIVDALEALLHAVCYNKTDLSITWTDRIQAAFFDYLLQPNINNIAERTPSEIIIYFTDNKGTFESLLVLGESVMTYVPITYGYELHKLCEQARMRLALTTEQPVDVCLHEPANSMQE